MSPISHFSIRFGISLCALLILVIPNNTSVIELPTHTEIPVQELPKEISAARAHTILFVGDIFLGRAVERLTDQYGDQYPFLKTADLIQQADVAIGNFEGSVPEVHVPTPNFGFSFSIHERFFPILEATGFDVLSLANNHAYDFGTHGFAHTQLVCAKTSITCTGHPHNLPSYATTSVMVGSTSVGILSLHALNSLDTETLPTLVRSLKQYDLTITYIHWGDEYETVHNNSQEVLAHTLIDSGIDAVIGHHPHVIQDIEVYKDRPIFYSLGNFVFDQYFTDDVMRGIGVALTITDTEYTYTIIPFESATVRSQPHVLEGTDQDTSVSDLICPGGEDSTEDDSCIFSFPRT